MDDATVSNRLTVLLELLQNASELHENTVRDLIDEVSCLMRICDRRSHGVLKKVLSDIPAVIVEGLSTLQ